MGDGDAVPLCRGGHAPRLRARRGGRAVLRGGQPRLPCTDGAAGSKSREAVDARQIRRVDRHSGHKRARHPQRKRPCVEGYCPRAAMDGQAADAAVFAALVDEAVRADSAGEVERRADDGGREAGQEEGGGAAGGLGASAAAAARAGEGTAQNRHRNRRDSAADDAAGGRGGLSPAG